MIIAAVCLASTAFYWVYERGQGSHGALASAPEFPSPDSTHSGEASSRVADSAPHRAAETKATAAPADAAIPLRTGEVLDYSADVAKLTNVANLRLQIAGRPDFQGKKVCISSL